MNLDLSFFLPKSLEKSLLCFTFTESQDFAPDIAICTSNGYIYEFKGKKVVGSLNINGEKASSISAYYFHEELKLILYYLVFTNTNKLLLVKKVDDRLQKVMIYNNVKEFEVYDFQCTGYPQIKINFCSSLKTETVDFPICKTVISDIDEDDFGDDNFAPSLSEKYQMMNKHICELKEECINIKKISSANSISQKDTCSLVPVSILKFSAHSKEEIIPNIKILGTCSKIYGKNWILTMQICNTCEVMLNSFELIINQKKINKYSYCCFSTSPKSNGKSFRPSILDSTAIQPEQEIFLTVVFPIPAFVLESNLFVTCYLASSDFENCLKLQEVDVGVMELVTRNLEMAHEFTIVHLMAMMTTNIETRITIETMDEEKNLIETVLVDNLGFKKLQFYNEKFFYSTSAYLNEVGVALQQKTSRLHTWYMLLYSRNFDQIYFLVNALYELLPEKTTILYCTE